MKDMYLSLRCIHLDMKRVNSISNGIDLKKIGPFHPLIQTVPYIAFLVENLKAAIKGKKVIQEPFEPIGPGYTVAFIEENGSPIEFIGNNTN